MATARFIYDTPYKNTDLYYATKFLAVDPLVYFEFKGKKHIVVDVLEFGRAKKEAKVDKVILAQDYTKDLEIRKGFVIEVMDVVFKKMRINTLEVHPNFPFSVAEKFTKRKYKIISGQSPFFPERAQKTLKEKKMMIESQRVTFKLIGMVEKILADSKIRGNRIYYKNKILTSEILKEIVLIEALKQRYIAEFGLIIACDKQSVDPHAQGHGPIIPHKSIVVDIFPKSQKTSYYGDATRTFCKGKASPELRKLYDTVKKGQELGLKSIRAGVNGRTVHEGITKFFDSCGYKTGNIGGTHQGFIHGTGHGIGLELHEYPPNINARDCILKAGHVTSVEPGLYYKKIGGVRIEDLVYVTKTGCEILSHYPKRLEIP